MNNVTRLRNISITTQPSNIGLQHLRNAVAAADHGSFRQAANTLLLRQSTLSRCIRQLEESIGIAVFKRSSGGVRPTAGGREFLRAARSILDQMDTLITATQNSTRGKVGRLTIGLYTSLSAGNLRATLLEFRNRFPQIELATVENSQTRLISSLRHDALDIAIVRGEIHFLDSNALPLWSERILLALLDRHQLANRGTIYWNDLQNETVLLNEFDRGCGLEDILNSKLIDLECRLNIQHHDVSCGIIKGLVSAGFGVSLVTESDIGASISGLIYRDLQDSTGPTRLGYSAHWKEQNDNPALALFVEFLRERYPLPAV